MRRTYCAVFLWPSQYGRALPTLQDVSDGATNHFPDCKQPAPPLSFSVMPKDRMNNSTMPGHTPMLASQANLLGLQALGGRYCLAESECNSA